MLLGAHMPTAGGIVNGVLRGEAIGCDIVQVFTKSPQQWRCKELTEEECATFQSEARSRLVGPTVAHDSYLINLASGNPELLRKSQDAFVDELHRADSLGIEYLVTHMGAFKDTSEEEGLARLCESLEAILERCEGVRTTICLETTAGQGSSLGYRFEHFPFIFEHVRQSDRLAICFDTCHVFASGYDLASDEACEQTLAEFDRVVGLDRVRVFHLNGSKREMGSRVDRHAHIGEGDLGTAVFRYLMNDPRFTDRLGILETPEAETMHAVNLARLRELRSCGAAPLTKELVL